MTETMLKLTALDAEDLEVLSAHLQDAVLTVGDLKYLPAEQRFAGVMNRFDWSGAASGDKGPDGKPFRRRKTGLRFDRVRAVRAQNIRMDDKEAILSLLAVSFEATEDPSGHVTLHFSGGGAVRLDVECIEAGLADLGPVWGTGNRPEHDLDETSGPSS